MQIQDLAVEQAERRQRVFALKVGAAASEVLAIMLLVAIGFVYKQHSLQKRAVAELLSHAAAVHDADSGAALLTATHAVVVANGFRVMNGQIEQSAKKSVARVLWALPDKTDELPQAEKNDPIVSGRDSLLISPPGYIAVRAEKPIVIRRIGSDGGLTSDSIGAAANVGFDKDTFLTISEPLKNTVLIMASSSQAGAGLHSRISIIRNRQQHGPFDAEELSNKFNVLSAAESRALFKATEQADLNITLSGDVIVLTSDKGTKEVVRTLVINQDFNQPDPFALGVEFETDRPPPPPLPKKMEETRAVPPMQFVAGGHWLFANMRSNGEPPPMPSPVLTAVRTRSLRGKNPHGLEDIEKSSHGGEVAPFPIPAGCDVSNKVCTLQFVPNPINNGLIVLGLSLPIAMSQTQQYAASAYSSYIVLDAETRLSREIQAETLKNAQAGCGVFPLDERRTTTDINPSESAALNSPTFVDGDLDDLAFGFVTASSIRIVRVSRSAVVCVEHLYLRTVIKQWRFAPRSNRLMAISDKQFLSWDLSKKQDDGEYEAMNDASLLAVVCTKGLEYSLEANENVDSLQQLGEGVSCAKSSAL